jgi:hypothetical protein
MLTNRIYFAEFRAALFAKYLLWRGARAMYEDGMQIIWDVVAKRVTIVFRGRLFKLSTKFTDRRAGIEAGEQRCRELGWRPAGVS